MKKRTNPINLVHNTTYTRRPTLWDRIPQEEREYITSVANVMKDNPNASVYRVASAIIEELGSTISHTTMVRILKGLLNGKM